MIHWLSRLAGAVERVMNAVLGATGTRVFELTRVLERASRLNSFAATRIRVDRCALPGFFNRSCQPASMNKYDIRAILMIYLLIKIYVPLRKTYKTLQKHYKSLCLLPHSLCPFLLKLLTFDVTLQRLKFPCKLTVHNIIIRLV